MKALFRSLPALLFLLAVSVAGGQDESRLEKLKESFETRRSASAEEHAAAMEKLREGYRGALQRLQERAQKSGKLEDVLPVRDEIQRLDEKADPLPPPAATASPELKQLRETYDKAVERGTRTHSQERVAMSEKMVALLEKESAALTKAGKIEEALAAKTLAAELAADPQLAAARESSGLGRRNEAMTFADARIKILETKHPFVGMIGARDYETVHDLVRKAYEEADQKAGNLFVLQAPAKIELRFPRRITRFKADAFHGYTGGGAATRFRVIVDGKTVETVDIGDPPSNRKPIQCQFEATDRIVIEAELLSGGGNWSALIAPEVR
jgi:hypothetical protein